MNFDPLMKLGKWAPIRNCPGRLVLRGVLPVHNLVSLLGDIAGARQFLSPKEIAPILPTIATRHHVHRLSPRIDV